MAIHLQCLLLLSLLVSAYAFGVPFLDNGPQFSQRPVPKPRPGGVGSSNGDGGVDVINDSHAAFYNQVGASGSEPVPTPDQVTARNPDFETNFMGKWEIHNDNAGVSAMQCQLLPNNKVIMYDATSLGPSTIQLQPKGNCRPVPGKPGQVDCWAHAVEYDIETAEVRPLKLLTDAWCSSGGVTPNGNLFSTGGFKDGGKGVRFLYMCPFCDFVENATGLARPRWYSTQEKLEDGNFIIFGGRREFNYEIVWNSLSFTQQNVPLQFLYDTTDLFENNLYPFAFLLPDGNVFLFANNRAIILNPYYHRVERELPQLPGGSRNYPSSGLAALLPLRINPHDPTVPIEAEVLICGGNSPDGMEQAEKRNIFLPALQDCGRIAPLRPDAQWEIDTMPSRRTMGDMLLLPNGEVLILNGAKEGVSGWYLADKPNFTPVLYNVKKPLGQRFKELQPSTIPRMYHSSSAVLPDGQVLVAGSNPNSHYQFDNTKFPTELRVEKFTPPYLDPMMDQYRPVIAPQLVARIMFYNQDFVLEMAHVDGISPADFEVTLLSPPFTTHGYSQNQRLVVLEPLEVTQFFIRVKVPMSGKIAPPGYYILYVVYRGVPSKGIWVKIQ
ncbi:Galactose oxidase [Bertholletia excelsa]